MSAIPLSPVDELEIHVMPRTELGYPVYTRSSRFGEAQAYSALDPEEAWLTDRRQLLHTSQLSMAQLEQLGTLLLCGDHNHDLHGLLRDSTLSHLRTCLGAALASPDGSLRIRLKIEPPELAALEWEYLFDPERHAFLSTEPRVFLLRSLSAARPMPPLKAALPLRGLLITSDARELELRSEVEALRTLAGEFPNLLEWVVLEDQLTVEAIQQVLQRRPFHLLHFCGHGRFDSEQQGVLYLDAEKKRVLSERSLADLVLAHPTIRLVVLNACHTGSSDPQTGVGGMAQRLLKREVPAVVVMQRAIHDISAIRFSRALYRALMVQGAGDVAAAVNLARAALLVSAEGAGNRRKEPNATMRSGTTSDFGIPVLYARTSDTHLFQLSGLATQAEVQPSKLGGAEDAREGYGRGTVQKSGHLPTPTQESEHVSSGRASAQLERARFGSSFSKPNVARILLSVATLLFAVWLLRALRTTPVFEPSPLLKIILLEDQNDPGFAPALAADKGKLRFHLAQELVPMLLKHGVRAVAFDFSISRATSTEAKEALEKMLIEAHAKSPPIPIVAIDSDVPLIDACGVPRRTEACFDGLMSKLLVAQETADRENSGTRRLNTVDTCVGGQGTLANTIADWLRALPGSLPEPVVLPPPLSTGCQNQSIPVPGVLFTLLDYAPLSSVQVLQETAAEQLRDHVVLIGMGHADFGDRIRMSLPDGQERTVAGVLLQQVAVESILQQKGK